MLFYLLNRLRETVAGFFLRLVQYHKITSVIPL